jgi:uncharacterized protein
MKTIRIFSILFFVITAVIFIFSLNIVTLLTDWWFFEEVGFTEIFTKSVITRAEVWFAATMLSFAFLMTNFLIASHSKIPWMSAIPESVFGQPITVNSGLVKKISIIICFIVAVFIGLTASSNWQDILKFLEGVPFDQKDPLFGKDVGFYIYTLPIYTFVLALLKILILISAVGSGIIYILRNLNKFQTVIKKLSLNVIGFDKAARIHLGILISLFLILLAVDKYLSLYDLLLTQSGPVFGAAFTDVNVVIPIIYISVFTYALAALLALFYGISGKISPLLAVVFLTVLVGISSAVVPSVFQRLVVAPNELVKETPFIKHNIEFTRKAYGLDKVEERDIAADKSLTSSDITANELTIKNVRLWDRDPLLSTFSQIQEIRTYYEFASVDNDRYIIDGEVRQIMLSPRELASNSLPNLTWINERLTFTHGYGITAGPVNQVTPEGLPVLFVKNLPPVSETKELNVERPEIYFGEILNDYVIVNTKSKEFDYPKGEENVYTSYKGLGGVEINSFLRRLFYSLRFGDLKLLLSNEVTNKSRILFYRDVKERIETIAPFLTFDRDPYIVVADGKLYWIMDAYTDSNRYPYSQPLLLNRQETNYIRNSVKIIVDAYDGSVNIYVSDTDDPIIKTYARIFPKTFQKLSEMPKSLLQHIRYPEDLFSAQTAIYTTYHMDDPQIFYNKEDQWEIPAVSTGNQDGDGAPAMAPRHLIMKLPGESAEEFILMLPFTPRGKDNLSAWMVARNDGQEYGKLLVYRFPKDKLIFGPRQVMGRINQDSEIARQISLWDQRGSQVIQGPLLVIPIEESLVYVRPLYLKAESGKIPELKRVIVAYENKIAMEETLEQGLAVIFGTTASQTQTTGATPPEITKIETTDTNLLQQAQGAYDAAIRAQRDGNWTRYGEEIGKLGEILRKISQ